MNNKGQVTIFVIVGIILVVTISLVFFANKKGIISRGGDFDSPESYLDNCVRERAEEVISEMLSGGGFIGVNDTKMYNGVQVTYLCKNVNNFEPCINQYPLYVSQVEKELEYEVKNDVEECFALMKQEFERKNYEFNAGEIDIDAKLKPSVVELEIKSDVSINKNEVSKTFKRFEMIIPSRIYDLAFIANEIVAQEARWCYFSNDGFMTLYRDYDIRVDLLDETTKIYTIEDMRTSDKLIMATRGCARPAGLF